MGWTGFAGSRADGIADALKPWPYQDGRVSVVIDKSIRGQRVWTVREYQKDGKPTGERFILLTLVNARGGKEVSTKDICEEMGPCYYDCPLKFFDMVPCPTGEYAGPWRDKVRAHHARVAQAAAKVVEVGATYQDRGKPGNTVKVYEIRKGRAGIIGIASDDGKLYRWQRGRLGERIA